MITKDLFATPIFTTNFGDATSFNQSLKDEMMSTNVVDIFQIQKPHIQELKKRIWEHTLNISEKYKFYYPPGNVHGRYNIIKPYESDTPHHHVGSVLVGVYYVDVPDNSGDILLHDPRNAVSWNNLNYEPNDPSPMKYYRSYHRVKPSNGLLIFMPGFLEHSVETNLSGKNRISIVFNIGNH
jgi:uncharacterized protein (TIGR02466 family)